MSGDSDLRAFLPLDTRWSPGGSSEAVDTLGNHLVPPACPRWIPAFFPVKGLDVSYQFYAISVWNMVQRGCWDAGGLGLDAGFGSLLFLLLSNFP